MLTTLLLALAPLSQDLGILPVEPPAPVAPMAADWLVDEGDWQAKVYRSADFKELVLSNGLVRRAWRLAPNGACVALDDLRTGVSILRAVKPSARVTVDGQSFDVGGLTGQPNGAYLDPDWLDELALDPNAMRLTNWKVLEPKERVRWPRTRHAAKDAVWPPKGKRLRLDFEADACPGITVSVHVELYDGSPIFTKWITVENAGDEPVMLDRFTSEILAVVEAENWVETRLDIPLPVPQQLHVETDFSFGGFTHGNANRHVVHWRADPEYTSIVNYTRDMPSMLVVEPTYGPAQSIPAGETFTSHHTFELVQDSSDRERRGLGVRRLARTLAPWVTENPLMHHMRTSDPGEVRRAIDDAASVGFEVVLMSFGSGFNIENDDPLYVAQWRELSDYAHERGIELGGYSLLSSRRVGDEHQIVSPEGQSPTHGACPALTSEWGLEYLAKVTAFLEDAGFDLLEHDGPYPGDVDVTSRPPYQVGEADSRWVQWRLSAGLYSWCLENGVYVNAPDRYIFNGSTKCGMGYREVNWSLPRAQQVLHTRQNIFDGTWQSPPTMGWMFVPLTQYHGGGAEATVEPLDEHLDHYERMVTSNLGLGVQACYRGPRLFDTERTKAMLAGWVTWFKAHRDILESDVVHGRRADGRGIDWMLHVNPRLDERGMLLVYNPLGRDVTQRIRVDLHYTGIRGTASVQAGEAAPSPHNVDDQGFLELEVHVPAGGMSWYVLR